MPYIGKSPLHGNYSKLDSISGSFNGSTTQFALATNGIAVTPVTEAALLISINGVLQEPTTAYTVSGTNITFTSAPASTDTFYGVALGEQLAIGTPSDASVTPAKLNITSALVPASADGAALGSTSYEWSDLYLADSGVIYFGEDQDVTVTHVHNDGLIIKSIPTADDNPLVLTLQTGETTMVADEPIAQIHFQAPDEASGTDAILIAATIQATAEGAFSSSSNATSLDFMTGSSEAATKKWSIKSDGKFEAAGAYAVDLNAGELILDANGNTSITADTDDQIDFKIAGADDFRMTANNFNVLSGSTLTIDSGATITNSGTATNFGIDPESAYAGVLQTNANFVDQVIFGPAVDGRAWNGLWNKASLFSSLMLATIEDEGSNTEINIWDLTQQSAGVISTTPLATVDLADDATPTSIAACMGYIIVGSEDGISIVDPHSGAWAERLDGWPRNLKDNTAPALTNNDVQDVAAGISDQPPFDPRTGGPLPDFACAYGTGADAFSLIKHDGNVWDFASTVSDDPLCIITSDGMVGGTRSGDVFEMSQLSISGIAADDFGAWGNYSGAFTAESAWDEHGGLLVGGSSALFTQMLLRNLAGTQNSSQAQEVVYCHTNRTYTTGYMSGDIRGSFLANSDVTDRSVKGNTLTKSGTITEAAVASGTELNMYGPFSTSNYLSRANDTDFAPTTGDFCVMGWFKFTGGGNQIIFRYGVDGTNTNSWLVQMNSDETIRFMARDSAANNVEVDASGDAPGAGHFEDSKWHMFVGTVDRNADILSLYIDGTLKGSASTSSLVSITNTSQLLEIGCQNTGGTPSTAADSGYFALFRFSATHINAQQVRQIFDAEKGMFVANAECLLQSGTTDAVLDVNVDPLTGKTLVTQTDAITIFDGLVVDSKPTVNSGASEKGKLWGALRAEQNSANAYVTAPAVDQRQINEMVRGLASDLPAGVDLGKAKAWINQGSVGTTATIISSWNIKSVTRTGTGLYDVVFGTPFKADTAGSGTAAQVGWSGSITGGYYAVMYFDNSEECTRFTARVQTRHTDNTNYDSKFMAIFFGELENE